MLPMRVAGLLILIAGLLLVGISGDNHRPANGRKITYGAFLIGSGATVSIFASQFEIMMGWFWR